MEGSTIIFSLMSFFPLLRPNIMHSKVLVPLANLMDDAALSFQIDGLTFLTNLLRNWQSAYGAAVADELIGGLNAVLIQETLDSIVSFFNTFGLRILEQASDALEAQEVILQFYETLCGCRIAEVVPRVVMMSQKVASRMLLSTAPSTLSRMCGIIASYRPLCVSSESSPSIEVYNSMVMDTCNLLWRDMAFSEDSYYGLHPSYIEQLNRFCSSNGHVLAGLFSLTGSMYLVQSALHFRDLEVKQMTMTATLLKGRVTEEMLEQQSFSGGISIEYDQFRVELLNKLKALGHEGLHSFLFTSLRSLMQLQERS
jgi:hypothetical protein